MNQKRVARELGSHTVSRNSSAVSREQRNSVPVKSETMPRSPLQGRLSGRAPSKFSAQRTNQTNQYFFDARKKSVDDKKPEFGSSECLKQGKNQDQANKIESKMNLSKAILNQEGQKIPTPFNRLRKSQESARTGVSGGSELEGYFKNFSKILTTYSTSYMDNYNKTMKLPRSQVANHPEPETKYAQQ